MSIFLRQKYSDIQFKTYCMRKLFCQHIYPVSRKKFSKIATFRAPDCTLMPRISGSLVQLRRSPSEEVSSRRFRETGMTREENRQTSPPASVKRVFLLAIANPGKMSQVEDYFSWIEKCPFPGCHDPLPSASRGQSYSRLRKSGEFQRRFFY